MPASELEQRWRARKKKERSGKVREKAGEKASLGSRASSLESTEEWGWMLRHMQQEMELKSDQLEQIKATLVNPESGMSDLEALALRQKGTRLQTEFSVFEYLSGLPEKLAKEGKVALKELKLADSS